jgi:hypothetical protein
LDHIQRELALTKTLIVAALQDGVTANLIAVSIDEAQYRLLAPSSGWRMSVIWPLL